MSFDKIIIAGLILISLFFLACAVREAPLPAVVEPVSSQIKEEAKATAKEGWEKEWEKTLEEARKEGKVVIYGAPGLSGALREGAVKPFKEKFGLTLEVVAARGPDTIRKIISERDAGLFIPDIYMAGPTLVYTVLKPRGFIEPLEPALILPEVRDPNLWLWGKLPWGDEERKVLNSLGHVSSEIATNTIMVKPDEIKSYYDLLEPKWKGKIVADDPTLDSNGFSSFIKLVENKIVDVDFFRQLLANQEITFLRNPDLQVRWLAMGKFPVAFSASDALLGRYAAEGAPIRQIIPKEGANLTMGGASVVLMNKAPNPNATKIFINWYLSREAQRIIQVGVQKQSLRVDIPTDNLQVVRQPGVEYFPDPTVDEKFVLETYNKYMTLVKDIYGPFLK